VSETETFWQSRDPAQLDQARSDPKHHMALVLRWYLGKSSRWAIGGDTARRADYQIWCSPAMGAFNAWVKGSFLEDPAGRSVVQIARNLRATCSKALRSWRERSSSVRTESPLPPTRFISDRGP
jgi:trans-AT polyketide synthase/acyltransferase/oxidoreductase domain-containing protein